MKNRRGFTLMELLIVVAVITIMISIALPTFNGARRKAAENSDIENVSALWTQLQSEYAIYGKFKSNNTLTNMEQKFNPNNENAKDIVLLNLDPAVGWSAGGTVTIKYEKNGDTVTWCANCT